MTDGTSSGYRVLARKYRPTRFDELIGQDALVRTLRNAIRLGRVAHAFMLTGVRGVGKTTTARIIARALNCIGADGGGGPTADPCGVCEHCRSIGEDRHVDVIEMDAASRTGIDDIRELIEGVRYRPVTARYKIYIVDEVHMLSRQAFNGLLKTLEEPPEHCIFVFATTEIRKVPVTVLSRCQRFDLRRVPMQLLRDHFRRVAESEGVAATEEALTLIAHAADGSVRDGLSLLDQAIALAGDRVEAGIVRDMLGLADRGAVYDLMEAVLAGRLPDALGQFSDMYAKGADPLIVIQDLLDVTHWLTRVRVVPALANEPGVAELEAVRGAPMAARLSMPVLTRLWQMLLKGLQEVQYAPAPAQAVEMLLVRLAYAADLPSPGDLVETLTGSRESVAAPSVPPPREPTETAPVRAAAAPPPSPGDAKDASLPERPAAPIIDDDDEADGSPDEFWEREVAADVPSPDEAPTPPANPRDFREVVDLFATRREAILTAHLMHAVHLVAFAPGRIEVRLAPSAPRDLPGRLSACLGEWTGRRWVVTVSQAEGEPTLAEQEALAEQVRLAAAEALPLVQAVKQHFPGARITRVSHAESPASATQAPASSDEERQA